MAILSAIVETICLHVRVRFQCCLVCVQVNPVIPETVNQIAFQVVGQDLTVTMASESGQLQLNVFEPVMACECTSSLWRLCLC